MANEPIEQLIRIIAKAEVDAAVKQAQEELATVATTTNKAFDAAKPKTFTAEVVKFKNQLFSLKPLLGNVSQLFAGFSLANLAGAGISALVDKIRAYFAETKAAEEQTQKLGRQLSLLGRAGATGEFKNFGEDLSKFVGIAESEGLKLANLAANLGATFRERGQAASFATELKQLGFGFDEITKAITGYLAVAKGGVGGLKDLSDALGVNVTDENFVRVRELISALAEIQQLNKNPVSSGLSPADYLQRYTAVQEKIATLTREIGLVGVDQAKVEKERLDLLKSQSEELERQRQERIQLLRQGQGPSGEQVKQAITDAGKLVTVYGTARDAVGTILDGLQDVTAETTRWALSSERTGLKLRAILSQIAGRLAGLIAQYAILSLFGGGAPINVRPGSTQAGPDIPSYQGSGSGASLGAFPGGSGSSANAGLRTFGGGGQARAGGGGSGYGVPLVSEDGDAWFLRMLARHQNSVLHIYANGRQNNPAFRNAQRGRY